MFLNAMLNEKFSKKSERNEKKKKKISENNERADFTVALTFSC